MKQLSLSLAAFALIAGTSLSQAVVSIPNDNTKTGAFRLGIGVSLVGLDEFLTKAEAFAEPLPQRPLGQEWTGEVTVAASEKQARREAQYRLMGKKGPYCTCLGVDEDTKSSDFEMHVCVMLVGRCHPEYVDIDDRFAALHKSFQDNPLEFTRKHGTHYVAGVHRGFAYHGFQSYSAHSSSAVRELYASANMKRGLVSFAASARQHAERSASWHKGAMRFTAIGAIDPKAAESVVNAYLDNPDKPIRVTIGEGATPVPLVWELRSYSSLFGVGDSPEVLEQAVERVLSLGQLLRFSDALGTQQAQQLRAMRNSLLDALKAYAGAQDEASVAAIRRLVMLPVPTPRLHTLLRATAAGYVANSIKGPGGSFDVPYFKGVTTTVPVEVVPDHTNSVTPMLVREGANGPTLEAAAEPLTMANSTIWGSLEVPSLDFDLHHGRAGRARPVLNDWTPGAPMLVKFVVWARPLWLEANEPNQLVQCYLDATTRPMRVLSEEEFQEKFASYRMVVQ